MNMYPTFISEYLNSQSVKTNIDGQIIGGTQMNLVPHLDPDTCRLKQSVFESRAVLLPYQKFEKMDDAALHKSANLLASKIAALHPGINQQELQEKCYNFVSSMRDYARVHDPLLKSTPVSPSSVPIDNKSFIMWSSIGAGAVILLIVIMILSHRKSS